MFSVRNQNLFKTSDSSDINI